MNRPYYVLTNYNCINDTYDNVVRKVQVVHYDTDKRLHFVFENEIGEVKRGYVWKLNTPHDMILTYGNNKYTYKKYNKYRLSSSKFTRKCKRHNVLLGGIWGGKTECMVKMTLKLEGRK